MSAREWGQAWPTGAGALGRGRRPSEPGGEGHRVLVAGIGNFFLGDDGFGVEVARRLAERPMGPGVTVKDFGIRGLDLAYALRDYDTVVFVDAAPRGGEPGTLYLIEADLDDHRAATVQTHGVDPVQVLGFAREVGPLPERVYVVGCEPAVVPTEEGDAFVGGLSAPVRAAVDEAVRQVEVLLAELSADQRTQAEG